MLILALLGLTAPALAQNSGAAVRPQTGTATSTATAQDGLPIAVTDERIDVRADYRGARVSVLAINPTLRGRLRGDMAVVLRGPPQTMQVRRKRPFMGLWVERDPVTFTEVPALLYIASQRPLRAIASPQAVVALRLDPLSTARLDSPTPADADPRAYRLGLNRQMEERGLYREYIGNDVRTFEEVAPGIYWAHFQIPANAPIGSYQAQVLYFRDGQLISSATRPVEIARIGVEQIIHTQAQDRPLLFGIAVVLVALSTGWLAALVFRR